MPFNLYFNDLCPKCRKPTMGAVIEAHPTDRDLALEKFHCSDCGPIKIKFISLKPIKPQSGIAA
jgi:hypothetical protein